MTMAEWMGFAVLGAGLLPALSSRGWWIAALIVIAAAIMAVGTSICVEGIDGLAALFCIVMLIAGGLLGLASIGVGFARWRYRRFGAKTALGRPWVIALILYGLAVSGFAGFILVLTG